MGTFRFVLSSQSSGVSIQSDGNQRALPSANDSFGSTSAGQGALRALVKSDVNNCPSRMQMTGQWQCKRVVKWNAILQLAYDSAIRAVGVKLAVQVMPPSTLLTALRVPLAIVR